MITKGLAGATPKGKKAKNKVKPTRDLLNRIVGMLPLSDHLDKDMDAFQDGKTNKTRQVGMKARFPGTKDHKPGTSRLMIGCVCEVSKSHNGAPTWPGNWRSCYGPKDVSATHPKMLEKGSTAAKPVYAKFVGKRKRDKGKPRSA